MSISRHVAVVLVATLWLIGGTAHAEPQVSCTGCVVTDEFGHELWGRGEDVPLPNASTTKMVTAMVALQKVPLADRVTVSPSAAATPGGLWELAPGETYSVRELLYGLLMASSNDAAVALAEHASGSVSDFVAEMNAEAQSLGAEATHFVSPHGLDAPGHESTARDLAALGLALLQRPLLARIVATRSYELSDGTTLANSNLLLESYDGAIGIKTGSTDLAGEVLVAAARRRGATVVAVALGSADAASDAAAMLDYGFLSLRSAPGGAVVSFARSVVKAAREMAGA